MASPAQPRKVPEPPRAMTPPPKEPSRSPQATDARESSSFHPAFEARSTEKRNSRRLPRDTNSVRESLGQGARLVFEEDFDLFLIEDPRDDTVAEFRVANQVAFG